MTPAELYISIGFTLAVIFLSAVALWLGAMVAMGNRAWDDLDTIAPAMVIAILSVVAWPAAIVGVIGYAVVRFLGAETEDIT